MSNNNNSLLDMSLDDLIKTNKRSGGRSSSRNNNSGSAPGGPARRPRNSAGNRSTPYSTTPAKPWLFEDGAPNAGGSRSSSAIEAGTKLYISNLDYGVSNEDIKELFSEVGDLKRYSVDYDRSGRSEGTAEVVYSRRADALLALKKYNNVQLDGKAMKIEIAGTNVATPAVLPPLAYGMFGNSNGFNRSGQGRGGAAGRPRDGSYRGRSFGRGRGRGRSRGEQVSAEDLDADLEKYHTESMQTN